MQLRQGEKESRKKNASIEARSDQLLMLCMNIVVVVTVLVVLIVIVPNTN